jgi:sec-independent protein translocase protein TatA
MPSVGFPEMIVILVIALIVLGPKKLPEAGKSLGNGMRQFKDSLAGVTDHDDDRPAVTQTHTPAAAPTTPAAAVPVATPVAPTREPEHV